MSMISILFLNHFVPVHVLRQQERNFQFRKFLLSNIHHLQHDLIAAGNKLSHALWSQAAVA